MKQTKLRNILAYPQKMDLLGDIGHVVAIAPLIYVHLAMPLLCEQDYGPTVTLCVCVCA
jgi:hypothetical protein